MARPRKEAPPSGGSVQEPAQEPVRDEVKRMTSFSSEEEMAANLPENTMSTGGEGEPTPRRKRRSKAEMAAARGEVLPPEIDPLMQDPRYKRAVEEMRSAGLSTTVKTGFETVAVITQNGDWELESDEFKKVDDFSYVVSKKFPILDPTAHWWAMALYFFALLGTLCFKRIAKTEGSNIMKWLTDLVKGEEEVKTAQQIEDEKKRSV